MRLAVAARHYAAKMEVRPWHAKTAQAATPRREDRGGADLCQQLASNRRPNHDVNAEDLGCHLGHVAQTEAEYDAGLGEDAAYWAGSLTLPQGGRGIANLLDVGRVAGQSRTRRAIMHSHVGENH